MKCSSRRNCNTSQQKPLNPVRLRLNEVQLPKELQQSAQYSLPPSPSEATSRALRARAWTQPYLSSAQST